MLLKIVGVGVVCIFLSLILKQYKPEYSLLVNVCGGLVIVAMLLSGFGEVVESVLNLSEIAGIESGLFMPIMKIIGVGYVVEFVNDMAEDSGNKLLANKIVIGGKIAIFIIAIPIVQNLINAIFGVIL